MNYTKGEWLCHPIPDTDCMMWDVETDKNQIASVYTPYADDNKVEEIAANAHLIAASPRMYNACLSALGVMATLDQNKGWVKEISGTIQNVLNKAEGKA